MTDCAAIEARLDEVGSLVSRHALRDRLRILLAGQRDLERAFQRLALDRATGGPRDLVAIGQSLSGLETLLAAIEEAGLGGFRFASVDNRALSSLGVEIERAMEARPPARLGEGVCIRPGYSSQLDALRLGSSLDAQLAQLRDQYAQLTGKASLRLAKGRAGWWVEVGRSEGPIAHEQFELVETGPGGRLRYRTARLRQLQAQQLEQLERVEELEESLFRGLRQQVLSLGPSLLSLARALAEVDVVVGLATLAHERGWSRPEILHSDAPILTIEGGRHPVVEASLAARGATGGFVANSLHLGHDNSMHSNAMALITGPNMGGKSTFLRQTALLCILAQMGSHVPAQRMRLSPVDYLGTRIGAADDLCQDRSTFLVEMIETACLLQQATPRSLLLLDELGRGTAALEGMAIAAAVCHYLQALKCRTLFATHYAELAHELPNAQFLMTRVHPSDQMELIFDHRVVSGVARHSHAIAVAQMAGLPPAVISQARLFMATRGGETRGLRENNEIFSERKNEVIAERNTGIIAERNTGIIAGRNSEAVPTNESSEMIAGRNNEASLMILEQVKTVVANLDNLTPRQCQERLYQLKSLLPSAN